MSKKSIVGLSVLFGILFIVIAFVYWLTPAGMLPVHMPGYEVGSTHAHFKHGVASFIVALAVFAFGWFKSGETVPPEQTTQQ